MKHKINLTNIKAFIQGNYRLIVDNMNPSFVPKFMGLEPYKREQIAYRMEVCKDSCKTTCQSCGCSTPGKFFVDKQCGGNKYPDLMNEENWNKFKKENNI